MRRGRRYGALALATVLAACGDRAGESTAAPARPLRVAVAFAIGQRGDDGFNRGAAAGADEAALGGGVTLRYADGVPDAARRAQVDALADSADLVIGVGFLMSDALTRAAQRHPDVRFAVLDYAIPVDSAGRAVLPPPNLTGVVFREEEGAYLVGAAAGLASRTRTVGFVGGMDSPMIRRFEAGYEAGVRRTCPSCRVLAAFAGDTPAAFGDPALGRALAERQYAAGADVVFHAAGATGDGVFAAARAAPGRRVIGVDVDQQALAPGRTLTSMLKRIDVAMKDMIGRARDGALAGGLASYGVVEHGLGFVQDEGNAATMTPEVARHLDILRAGIAAGLIQVPATR